MMDGRVVEITAGRGYLAVPDAGEGPGLLLFSDIADDEHEQRRLCELYAAEGYVVLCPPLSAADKEADIAAAATALRGRAECTGKIGAIGYGVAGVEAACLAAAGSHVDCAVGYCGPDFGPELTEAAECPLVLHIAQGEPGTPPTAVARLRNALGGRPNVSIHVYPGLTPGFDRPSKPNFDKQAAGLAHSRSIGLLRGIIGPRYDLEALWERHTGYEFVSRDVDATMRTMVADPYVNHVPVMTGGVGQHDLARFYGHHFIPKCPADISLVPVSRTIGPDCVVDEMVVSFTHDVEIDWMLPGILPTGRRVEVPLVVVVKFRGDKICHEHIYWDQASVLLQIGLLDPAGLPVAGRDTAKKLLDETRPSNTLMKRWAESG